jgi:hypothetical protein
MTAEEELLNVEGDSRRQSLRTISKVSDDLSQMTGSLLVRTEK